MLGGADNPNGELLSYIIGADIPVRITGNVGAFGVLLASCGWQVLPSPEPGVLFLQAEQCG